MTFSLLYHFPVEIVFSGSKKARLIGNRTFLYERLFENCGELLHCVLEGLRCTELWYFHGWHFDLLSGFRIASHTCCTSFDREDAETCDRYFAALFQGADDCVHHAVYDLLSLYLGAANLLMNPVNECCFIHID